MRTRPSICLFGKYKALLSPMRSNDTDEKPKPKGESMQGQRLVLQRGVWFLLCLMIIASPKLLHGNCMEYLSVDDAQATKYLSRFAISVAAFTVLTAATAYAGYYADYYWRIGWNLSYTDLQGYQHYCKRTTGNWLCPSLNQTCLEFVNSCAYVQDRGNWAQAGFGVGFFLDVCASIGTYISGEYYCKANKKRSTALKNKQEKHKNTVRFYQKKLDFESSFDGLIEVYKNLLEKMPNISLTIVDVYLHLNKGLESEELCPNKTLFTDGEVVVWLLKQTPITKSSYEQFMAAMNTTQLAGQLVRFHKEFNEQAQQLSHSVYPGDESIDGKPVVQSKKALHNTIKQCVDDILLRYKIIDWSTME